MHDDWPTTPTGLTRARLLRGASALATAAALGGAAIGANAAPVGAQAALAPVDVAYAGSMGSLMEGPVKTAAAAHGLDLQGRAQGSNALANSIVGGTIRPDVFVAVTPSPMRIVLDARKAAIAVPVARTAMVIAYAPSSRFASAFAAAGRRGAMPWWDVLEQPGLRFGRTDPVGDPQGRNIIFTLQLAARLYRRPELVERVLGETRNPAQIFSEPSIEARLQSGELDAAAAYRIQPGPFGIPYVGLPAEVDLSDDRRRAHYAEAGLELDGKTYHPEPLVYYAAVLADAPHPAQAAAFVRFLAGQGQTLFHRAGYDGPGTSTPLRAG